LRFIIATLVLGALGIHAQDTPAKPSTAAKSKSTTKSRAKSPTSKSVAAKPATAKSSTPAARSAPAKPATKTVAHRSSTSTGKSTAKGKKPAAPPRRWAQQQPTSERYKEIQQALAGRGYFRGDPSGAWGPESIDSLKRFQHDQSLVEDGKIGSLSLIALGLGPKRTVVEPASEKTSLQENRQ
jgi:hypothetical protein